MTDLAAQRALAATRNTSFRRRTEAVSAAVDAITALTRMENER